MGKVIGILVLLFILSVIFCAVSRNWQGYCNNTRVYCKGDRCGVDSYPDSGSAAYRRGFSHYISISTE